MLNVLGDAGPVPISTLAERTGSANSTISGIVDRLEKLGLARRERSEHDRRVIYVSATEEYWKLREQTATDVSGYFNSILDTMGPEDKAMVAQAFLTGRASPRPFTIGRSIHSHGLQRLSL